MAAPACVNREKQILEHVEAGYSNVEIGARLHITSDCVKYLGAAI